MKNYMEEVLGFLNTKQAEVYSFRQPYLSKFSAFVCFFQYKKAIYLCRF